MEKALYKNTKTEDSLRIHIGNNNTWISVLADGVGGNWKYGIDPSLYSNLITKKYNKKYS